MTQGDKYAGHTPGPWWLDDYEMYIWGPNHEMVAQVRGFGAGLPQKANGQLLADAPALLAQNRALLAALKLAHEWISAKTDWDDGVPYVNKRYTPEVIPLDEQIRSAIADAEALLR